MSSSHQERYFSKLLVGFAAIMGSVILTYYAIFEEAAKKGDWYWWAIVASVLLCFGIFFSLSAFVHKIKSDFSRRQKTREMQKAPKNDEF